MRNGKLRGLLITVMLLVFLAGLASILYPYIWGAAVDSSITNTAKDFLDRETPELPTTTVIIDSIEPESQTLPGALGRYGAVQPKHCRPGAVRIVLCL